jgi:integrase
MNWERVEKGIHIGQPYLGRKSEFRDYWYARVAQRVSGEGRQRYVRLSLDRDEALAKARELRPTAAPTCKEVLRAWLDGPAWKLKADTRYRAKRLVARELTFFDRVLVHSVTADLLWEFTREQIAKGLGPSTISQALAWLSRAADLCYQRELPLIAWEPEGKSPKDTIQAAVRDVKDRYAHLVKPVEAFTPAEAKTLLEAARDVLPAFLPFLRLALGTGMRRSELRALEWDCVNLEECSLTLRRNFSGNERGPLKAGRIRYVQIPETLRDMLAELKAISTCKYVFECNGTFYTQSQVGHAIAAIMAEAVKRGVREGLSLHSTRHTYVTQGRRRLPDTFMAKQAGHSKAMQERYTHTDTRIIGQANLAWADFGVDTCA